jgi:hypothetical protein
VSSLGSLVMMVKDCSQWPTSCGDRLGSFQASQRPDELSLAKQLINVKTSKLDLSAYKNDYEAAVKRLVDAN